MKKIDRLRKETYNEALYLLETQKKCAIIRPTGFGKTGILTEIIKSGLYNKVLYLYPTDIVKQTVFNFYYGEGYRLLKGSSIPNVSFMTYMKATQLTDKDLRDIKGVDLIICDEYHKIGATETMEGLRQIIKDNKKAKLLGASATPDRMDMIDVTALFFKDITTSKYTLHDAFQDGILKKPYYCFCDYSQSDPAVLEKIKKDVMLKVGPNLSEQDRKDTRELLNGRMLEIANLAKMDKVIKKALKKSKADTKYQKYIVFFSTFKQMQDCMGDVKKWFKEAFPEHKVKGLIVSSETEEYHKNVRKLNTLKYRKNGIDLIFTCEMLNLGYHIGDLTGIIMYRSTYSNTIYIQQLGRALSTGDARPKIVFDVVDNIHRKSIYSMLGNTSITDADKKYDEIVQEYQALITKSMKKNKKGEPVKMTNEEKDRLVELGKIIKERNHNRKKKNGRYDANTLYQTDLIAVGEHASYRELIAKAVAEVESMPCRQAWQRWIEKGGDASIMTRDYILAQIPPNAVPLPPFCRAKNVSVQAVLDLMGVK